MNLRQFLPDRLDGGDWTDKALTATRGAMLLVLALVGQWIGWAHLGPAWFGTGWWQRLLGALAGLLLGALAYFLIDAASWTSGRRQEGYERDRAAARAAAGRDRVVQQAATAHNAPPVPRGRPAAPARPNRDARPRPTPTGVQVDERPAPPAPASSGPAWVQQELLEQVVKVVEAAGPRGATVEEVGDRLAALGVNPTTELLKRHLLHATTHVHQLTKVDNRRGDAYYFAPRELKVTEELVDQVADVIGQSGTVGRDVAQIRAALLMVGFDPAAPLLSRVLRILIADGRIIDMGLTEPCGRFVRSGL